MADQKIGTRTGVAAASIGGGANKTNMNGRASAALATITADGVNTVTVSSTDLIKVGDIVDIRTRSTGAVVASTRTITDITSAGVVTYSGADVAATVNESIYLAGVTESNQLTSDHWDYRTIAGMRARLAAIDAGFYTARQLNKMTENDMLYAIRLNDAATTIKQ